MGFSDAQLLRYSEEHLHYELWMLVETTRPLIDDGNYSYDVVTENALLESFAVHARSLADFIYGVPKKSPTSPRDDVFATDYIDEGDLHNWSSALGEMPHFIRDARRRTNKEIAHLTVVRHYPKDLEKGWDVRAILSAFIVPFQTFALHANPSRLHERARTFIRDEFRPPTGTPTRRRFYNSTSSTATIWGKVLPDDPPQIRAKTDIRTRRE